VSDEAARRDEWARLRAERAATRASLARSLHALDVRARDPFRLKEKIRKHPYLVAGIAAGAGAVLVNLLMPKGSSDAGKRCADDDADAGDDGGGSRVFDSLRDAALRVATPWITRFVAERLGQYVDLGGPSETEPPPTNGTRR
jgi:hypothetical protein